MKFKKIYLIGIIIAVLVIALDVLLLYKSGYFWPLVIISLVIASIQFWIDFFSEIKRQREIEEKFLEFIRNLVESVKSGVSIPRSIINVSKKDYGALNPYVKKLANQIEWGIPTRKALLTFSFDTDNKIIKRSISIIVEAEQSGGDIRDILSSVVNSVINVKKLREERKATAYTQIIQGYIIFFVFIGIMLILQFWLFPKLTGISGVIQSGVSGISGISSSQSYNLDTVFLSLIIIQGFFAGIMIGKFSEGTIKNGLLHSLILITSSTLIITTVKGVL